MICARRTGSLRLHSKESKLQDLCVAWSNVELSFTGSKHPTRILDPQGDKLPFALDHCSDSNACRSQQARVCWRAHCRLRSAHVLGSLITQDFACSGGSVRAVLLQNPLRRLRESMRSRRDSSDKLRYQTDLLTGAFEITDSAGESRYLPPWR